MWEGAEVVQRVRSDSMAPARRLQAGDDPRCPKPVQLTIRHSVEGVKKRKQIGEAAKESKSVFYRFWDLQVCGVVVPPTPDFVEGPWRPGKALLARQLG